MRTNDFMVPRKPVAIRSARNYDRRAASEASAVDAGASEEYPGKAVQSMRDECDINVIVKRFNLTGQMPPNLRIPQYGDFSQVTDYKSAMDAVAAAKTSFNELPASVRSRFGYDPQAFLEFVSNGDNQEEMIKLGLAKRIVKEYTTESVVNRDDTGIEVVEENDNARRTDARASTGARASDKSGEAVKRKP